MFEQDFSWIKQVHSHSIRSIININMYTLTIFFGLFSTVWTDSTTVGSSYGLYSNIANAQHFQNVFQKMTPTPVRIDRSNASASYMTLYDQMLKLDRQLVGTLDGHVEDNLKAYNKMAYDYLGKIIGNDGDQSVQNDRLRRAIETIGYGGQGQARERDFRFLAYLKENGVETDPKYDNFLFYVYLNEMFEPSEQTAQSVLKRIRDLCGVECENGSEPGPVPNFEELTNQVNGNLTEIKRDFVECSNVFVNGVQDPLINVGDLFSDLKSKEERLDKDLFRIECRIQVR